MNRLKATKVKKKGFYKQEDWKEAEIKAMKSKFPGFGEDKLNAMVSKGAAYEDNSDIDE